MTIVLSGKTPTIERMCGGCGVTMEEEWFATPTACYCTACEDQKIRERPYSREETQRVIDASRGVLRLWSGRFGEWSEDELILWRELVDALDRRVCDREGE